MKEKKSKTLLVGIITFILGALIVAGLIFIFKDDIFKVQAVGNGACYTSCENKVTINDKGISDAVDKIYDAVLLISNYKDDKLQSTGTGFIYKVDNKYGYVLTNYHVINGSTSIKVIDSKDEIIDAKLLGGDEYLDVAVITIPKEKVRKVAVIGTSKTSKLGDTVFTVGSPVGQEYKGTVTRGILSGKDRLVSATNQSTKENYITRVLQTDAAMNPGNSGGPLVNTNGEVIGINSLKLVQNEIEGMGFAIPIEDVMTNIDTFEQSKEIKRPYLGLSMVDANNKTLLQQYGIILKDENQSGVVVIATVQGSPASKLFAKGDIITRIDDVKVANSTYLKYEIFNHKVGDKIKITFIHEGKEQTKSMTLESK